MFTFYLDNNQVSDPINWSDFTETIERDAIIKGLLPKYELKMTFSGGGYQYLFEKKNENGFCQMIELRVDYACSDGTLSTIIEGFIMISRCKFNLNRCIVDCEVVDNNYGARIFNNKSIKTPIIRYVDANTFTNSKNLVQIIPAVGQEVFMFNPANGIYYTASGNGRLGFSIYECFKFLIAFMTDNNVGFTSSISEFNSNFVFSGFELRTNTDKVPIISFEKLFDEVNKRMFPISFTIVQLNGKPTIKIEKDNYFYNSTSVLQLDNVMDMSQSFDSELLYSKVKVGGETAIFDPSIHHFIPQQFIGFTEEEYYLAGTCNIDKTLDLYGEWIVDSNMIEELIVTNTSNKDYDTKIFFMNVFRRPQDGFWYATKSLNKNETSVFHYNEIFTNQFPANANSVYADTLLWTGIDNSGFRASVTNRPYSYYGYLSGDYDFSHSDTGSYPVIPPDQSTTVQVKFNDDSTLPNYNYGLNYNTSVWRYNVPLDGNYFFLTDLNLKIYPNNPATTGIDINGNRSWQLTVTIKHWDSVNSVFTSYDTYSPAVTNGPFGFYRVTNAQYISCTVGDYVQVFATFESKVYNPFFDSDIRGLIDNTSYFKSIATSSGGGVFINGASNADNYKVSKVEFDRPLSNEDYQIIKGGLNKAITLNHDGQTNRNAWIRKISRNLSNGNTNWELITDINNS